LPAGSLLPTNPVLTATTFPNPAGGGGTMSDFGNNDWRNLWAAIRPLDLNRRVTGYPTDPPLPLGNGPLPPPLDPRDYAAARADRHALAKDIFVRLVIATGAMAVVNPSNGTLILPQPNTTPPPPTPYVITIPNSSGGPPTLIGVSQTEYDGLRYLAQLAVN